MKTIETANNSIIIRGCGFISPLGCTRSEAESAFTLGESSIREIEVEGVLAQAAPLSASGSAALEELRAEEPRFRDLDRSVLLAVFAAREAFKDSNWSRETPVSINIGSSRGATGLFERYYRSFLENKAGRAPVLTSPTTTLGNISSWVLQDLKLRGSAISHSMTCSTGLQALANGIAWLKSGMLTRALVGASEAPLTAFTIAQMRALKVYAAGGEEMTCRPLARHRSKGCGMVLGEGAGVLALESGSAKSGDVLVDGFGLSSEIIDSPTSISETGEAFYNAMQDALLMSGRETVDAIIMHAPGTQAGDEAELEAIKRKFHGHLPCILSNKWIIGHTFAAAGILAIEYAIYLLNGGMPPQYPYQTVLDIKKGAPNGISSVMINAAGFGGNAASVIVSSME